MKSRPTRPIYVGPVQIGGGAPVAVQSMTNTDTSQVGATLAQIERQVVAACQEQGVPLRLGVNAGSLESDLLAKYGSPTAPALVESAIRWVKQFEEWGFFVFKVSLKSADVLTTVAAYRELSRLVDYPLHVGGTEAGGVIPGTVKTALGVGRVLFEGIREH